MKAIFYRYKTPTELISKYYYFLYPDKKFNLETKIYFLPAKKKISLKKVIDCIKKRKIWGFHYKSKIYYWLNNRNFKNKNCEVINLISHELFHAYGFKNESKVEECASICEVSFKILNSIKNQKYIKINTKNYSEQI